MNRIYYNKLIRDHIKSNIEAKGEQCEVRELSDDAEFEQELLKKVAEESRALAHVRTRADFLEEYADLMAALDALTKLLEISPAELALTLEDNVSKKGLYTSRHFLHWSADSEYKSNETPQGIKKQ